MPADDATREDALPLRSFIEGGAHVGADGVTRPGPGPWVEEGDVTKNEYGVTTILLEQRYNTPGRIEVDGDLYDEGPVVIIHFELASEAVGEDQEIDFGTFRLIADEGAVKVRMRGGFHLGEAAARAFAEAILGHVEERK